MLCQFVNQFDCQFRGSQHIAAVVVDVLYRNDAMSHSTLFPSKSDEAPLLESIRSTVVDKTGYECFVNHIHLKEAGDSAAALRQAVTFCTRVVAEGVRVAPNRSLRFIISRNGEDWTVHFHTLRPHESYVSDDLEMYTEEAVLVLDSAELRLAAS